MMRRRILCPTVILLFIGIFGGGVAWSLTAQEQLGKDIFFDQNLSLNFNQSCAACHKPESGWTGPDPAINLHGAVYEGSVPGRFGNRKPPSSAYATQSPILHFDKKGLFVGGNFWDGRATGEKLGNPAADQAQGPFLNPMEQALPSPADVINKICVSTYAALFTQVCGPNACDTTTQGAVNAAYDCVALSVAAYEASPEVNAFTSKYDYARKGLAQLTSQEQRGFALFRGKGKCARCHVSNGQRPLFTDYTYDNLGVPKNPENPFYTELEVNPLGACWIDFGLGGYLQSRPEYAQYVRTNIGKQKVPTLRNVDLRPFLGFVKAYSHNGYFKSLEGIVHFYNTRDVLPVCPGEYTEAQALTDNCWPLPEMALNLNTTELGNLGLTPEDEGAIVAFLKTLSDGFMP